MHILSVDEKYTVNSIEKLLRGTDPIFTITLLFKGWERFSKIIHCLIHRVQNSKIPMTVP
jgi:hypothetical protein